MSSFAETLSLGHLIYLMYVVYGPHISAPSHVHEQYDICLADSILLFQFERAANCSEI